jgi:two-component system, chemotaxis family, chemotaxis protein CheY
MIVDDNKQMRKFLKSYFASSETEIIECQNGLEAYEIYFSVNPDYVFMDIKMPVLDGIEATRKIISAFPSAKIIIVTEFDDNHIREEAKKAGVQDYVLKDNLSLLRPYLNHSA